MTAGTIISVLLAALIVAAVVWHAVRRRWGARAGLVAGAGAAALLLGSAFAGGWAWLAGWQSDRPLVPLAAWTADAIGWLVTNYGDALRQYVSNPTERTIQVYTRFLHADVAWPLMALVFAGITYHASRRVWLTAFVLAAMVFIWSLNLWMHTMQTVSLITVAIAVTLVVGLPAGIIMGLSDRVQAVLTPVLDFMQTMPSFVYLIPVVMLFGLGTFAGVVATAVYAVPPLIRLTSLGIRLVDREIMEAATAFGATRWQTLWKVQVPLALPNLLAGINQSIMMALAMVVIASMISVKGLGQEVLYGITREAPGVGFAAGLCIVLLAIIFDRITQAYGRRLQAHLRTAEA